MSWEENLEVLTQRNAVITLHVSNMKEDVESYAEAKEANDTDDVIGECVLETPSGGTAQPKKRRKRRSSLEMLASNCSNNAIYERNQLEDTEQNMNQSSSPIEDVIEVRLRIYLCIDRPVTNI